MPSDPILLTIPDAAKTLAVSRSTLYELLQTGAIRSVTLGRRRLVEYASLQQFAASLPIVVPTKEMKNAR